jgi:protein KRI1
VEDKYKAKLASKGVTVSNVNGDEDYSSTDSEEDVVEDEDGELVTPAVEAQILRTLAEIRSRDGKIYDPNTKFFSPEELQKAEAEWKEKRKNLKKEKPLKLKDFHREKLLKGQADSSEEEEPVIKTHEEEQKDLLNEFKTAANATSDQEDGGLLRIRPKTEQEIANDDEEYKNFLLENLASNENARENMSEWFGSASGRTEVTNDENFLIEYVLNRGWVEKDRKAIPSYEEIIAEDEDDADAVDKMEEFEEKYNFRYEQPGGDQIVTYSRQIDGSMRREDGKRKEQRAAQKSRKEEEKERQREELKRLKNLKKQEIQEKLKKIQEISGTSKPIQVDLESDFDPESHDKKMELLFDDEYYGNDGESKPVWTESEDEEPISEAQAKVMKKAAKSIAKLAKKAAEDDRRQKMSEYLDEYYQLDYEDMIGGEIPCRFKYQKVKATTFGLKVRDLIMADDADLNSHVSLKKLAPYRPAEVLEADEARLGHKKRLYKFYDLVRKDDPKTKTPVSKKKKQ